VGLFGTVLGIIKAFHDLGVGTDEAASAVMAGISEALVATAVGLMVAIPAVILYNYFQSRNKSLVAELESMSHLLLSRFKGHHSKPPAPRAVGA
jgi:biopolymer transport protein ExbB